MRLAFGLIILLVGILLVFGFFSADVFLNLLINFSRFWPFIIILVGIGILSGVKGMKWLKYINALFIVVFVLSLFFWPAGTNYGRNYSHTLTMENQEASNEVIELRIDLPIAKLRIMPYDGTIDENTVGKIDYAVTYGNQLKVRESDGFTKIVYNIEPDSFWFSSSDISLMLNPGKKYRLILDSGILKGNLNLTGLNVEYVDIDSGIVNITINLPGGNDSDIKIDSGIMNSKILVPDNVNLSMNVEGLKSVKISEDYELENDYYIVKGTTENPVDSKVRMEAGFITANVSR